MFAESKVAFELLHSRKMSELVNFDQLLGAHRDSATVTLFRANPSHNY